MKNPTVTRLILGTLKGGAIAIVVALCLSLWLLIFDDRTGFDDTFGGVGSIFTFFAQFGLAFGFLMETIGGTLLNRLVSSRPNLLVRQLVMAVAGGGMTTLLLLAVSRSRELDFIGSVIVGWLICAVAGYFIERIAHTFLQNR